MRTFIFFFIVLGYCIHAMAQNPIPNAGFEEWDSIPGLRPFWEPKNYVSKNRAFQTTNRIYSFRSTDSHSGLYSLLATPAIDSSWNNGSGESRNSWLSLDTTLNPIVTLNSHVGIHYTYLPLPGFPLRLTGWYKYVPDSTTPWPWKRDPYIILLGLQNGSLPGVCGRGIKTFIDATNEWTFFSADFQDECPPLRPSKFSIIISFPSKNAIQNPLGKLWLDDLNLEYLPTSVAESVQKESFTIYPNPGKDFIQIHSSDLQFDEVRLVNVHGSILIEQGKPVSRINVRHLPSGIYFVKCLSKGTWYSKKWVKVD